jgi:hypothetical protein
MKRGRLGTVNRGLSFALGDLAPAACDLASVRRDLRSVLCDLASLVGRLISMRSYDVDAMTVGALPYEFSRLFRALRCDDSQDNNDGLQGGLATSLITGIYTADEKESVATLRGRGVFVLLSQCKMTT